MYFTYFSLILICVLGCKSPQESTIVTPPIEQIATSHTVVNVKDSLITANNPTITINRSKATVSGYTGCNTYSATFTGTNEDYKISNLRQTRKACARSMKLEEAFVRSLYQSNRLTKDKSVLTLYINESIVIVANSTDE